MTGSETIVDKDCACMCSMFFTAYCFCLLLSCQIVPEPLSFAHILQSLHSDAAKNRIYDDARGGSPAGAILQKQFEALVGAQLELKESAINAYHSYLRAYAAYPKSLKPIFHPRKLHIGHVARSFGLQDAPTALAKSEIVSKQRTAELREKEREKERLELQGERTTQAALSSARMNAASKKKVLIGSETTATKKSGPASASTESSASSETISSGIRPSFGQRDRARNAVAQANDAAWEERKAKRKSSGSSKKDVSSTGWKLGNEGTGNQVSKLARTGIDRARSSKVAQVFKKKKVDLVSEFAA